MKKLMFIAALVAAVIVNAEEVSTSKAQLENTASSLPTGLVPFVGAGLGYTDYSKQVDVEGVPSNLKLLGSYYLSEAPFVFDLGLGMNNQTFSQTDARDRNMNGAQAELAARYSFANRWQAGVVGNTLFNQGESYTAKQADLQLAGLQALKEFNVGDSWVARVGGRLLTGINTNETVNMALVDLQLGWNTNAKQSASVEQAQVSQPARPIAQVAPTPALVTVLANEKIASKNFLLFKSNQSAVASIDQARLKLLAAKLAKSESFGKLQVVGHADETGTTEKNDVLSLNRSESVKQLLTKYGISADKIVTVAKGDKEPVLATKNRKEMFVNRRVELKFVDVKDTTTLSSILSSIK